MIPARVVRRHPSVTVPRRPIPRDLEEDFRVHLHGARTALDAANTSGLERLLNQAAARSHVLAALALLQDQPG